MEAEINILARNQAFLSLVSGIAEKIVETFADTRTNLRPAAAENIVGSVLKVLDAADRYGDEHLQPHLEPLKHKLKVTIAEIRHSRETSLLQRLLSDSIQLLVLLENFEEEATKKLRSSVVLRLEQLVAADIAGNSEDMQLLVEALQCVPPFIHHLQTRLCLVLGKAFYWKFQAAALRSKFCVQFLANTFKLATNYPSSQSVKALKCFATQQLCMCLSKMCDAVCMETLSDGARQNVAGTFVEAMDQAIYLLSEVPSDENKSQLSTLVEALVSHGMSLHQLSVGDTKQKVYAACKEVVEQKVLLEGTSNDSITNNGLYNQYSKMAGTLERFEATVNIAVVELIVDNYMGLTIGLARLLEAAELYATERHAEEESANLSMGFKASVIDFCSVVDLVYNIVQQAVCCSTDEQRLSYLLSNLDALEQLDPELVAGAVALATDISDEGVRASVSHLRSTWEVHTRNLFRSLLHLTSPETFFGALDASLKSYIAKTEQGDPKTIKEMAVCASSAIDMCEVVFEDIGLPAALQVAVNHLVVALSALRNAHTDRVMKRVKVVRGCAWEVWEELRNHLPSSTVATSSGLDLAKLSEKTVQGAVATGSGNVAPTLDITELLNDMHFSTRSNISKAALSREEIGMMGETFHKRRDASKIFLSSLHGNISRLSQRPRTFVSESSGLNSVLQMTHQQRLERSIRLTEEAIGQSETGQWIQNNSSICALAHEMKQMAIEVCTMPSEMMVPSGGNCDIFAKLPQIARKFNEELTIVQSHLKDSTQHVRLGGELEKLQLQFGCCVSKLSIFAAALIKDPTLRVAPPIGVVEQMMSLASQALKVLSMSCKQVNAKRKCSLLGDHSCMSRLWMLKLSSCNNSATSV